MRRVRASLNLVTESLVDDPRLSSIIRAEENCREVLVDRLYGDVRRDAGKLKEMLLEHHHPDDPVFMALQPLLKAGKHL